MRGTRQGVSICGLGAVTGYGWGRKHLWDGLRSSESAVLPRPGYQEWLGHDVAYCAIVPEVERSDGLTRFGAAVSEAADEAIDNALDRGWRPGPGRRRDPRGRARRGRALEGVLPGARTAG